MRSRSSLVIAALIAGLGAPASAADLPWLVGYWLDCDGRTAVESWIDAGSDTLVGVGLTRGRTRTSFEFMRIAKGPDGALTFFGSPGGAPPVAFRLSRLDGRSAVFENPAHDFPQRVAYRREGDRLLARVEGRIDGKEISQDWAYAAAAPNTACPAP